MARARVGKRVGIGLLAVALAALTGTVALVLWPEGTLADPDDPRQVSLGKTVYARHCAVCHGAKLEGQARWRERLPSGRLPAPPHDASGHTWHHPDGILFGITRHGIVPGKYGPADYESDMPAFDNKLSDKEIWAVLAYIKSNWPEKVRQVQREMTMMQSRR